mmetsp:Transcript_45685/g.74507  ORF Transcript_45685/g.74507 Transcript_45685/m.74507 type:complete len:719 (+) Transcript_45685:125-2281(+)
MGRTEIAALTADQLVAEFERNDSNVERFFVVCVKKKVAPAVWDQLPSAISCLKHVSKMVVRFCFNGLEEGQSREDRSKLLAMLCNYLPNPKILVAMSLIDFSHLDPAAESALSTLIENCRGLHLLELLATYPHPMVTGRTRATTDPCSSMLIDAIIANQSITSVAISGALATPALSLLLHKKQLSLTVQKLEQLPWAAIERLPGDNPPLRSVSLSCESDSMCTMLEILAHTSTLECLKLEHNSITSDPAAVALGRVLASNRSTLHTLSLSSTRLGPRAIDLLHDFLATQQPLVPLKEVFLTDCKWKASTFAKGVLIARTAMGGLPNLINFYLSNEDQSGFAVIPVDALAAHLNSLPGGNVDWSKTKLPVGADVFVKFGDGRGYWPCQVRNPNDVDVAEFIGEREEGYSGKNIVELYGPGKLMPLEPECSVLAPFDDYASELETSMSMSPKLRLAINCKRRSPYSLTQKERVLFEDMSDVVPDIRSEEHANSIELPYGGATSSVPTSTAAAQAVSNVEQRQKRASASGRLEAAAASTSACASPLAASPAVSKQSHKRRRTYYVHEDSGEDDQGQRLQHNGISGPGKQQHLSLSGSMEHGGAAHQNSDKERAALDAFSTLQEMFLNYPDLRKRVNELEKENVALRAEVEQVQSKAVAALEVAALQAELHECRAQNGNLQMMWREAQDKLKALADGVRSSAHHHTAALFSDLTLLLDRCQS